MFKKIYIVLLLVFILLSSCLFVCASDINMNLQNNTTTSGASNTASPLNALSSLPETSLGLTNILNILLIVVGVLLILLAIAILIRLK